jgi:acyl phosphate:glycerol-3-phosphate acyltransferase
MIGSLNHFEGIRVHCWEGAIVHVILSQCGKKACQEASFLLGEESMGIEIFVVFFAYLLGSISFSYIIAKKIAGIDIRQHGSKNAGATNTLRVLGVWPAIAVLLLDAFKGVVAVLVAMALTDASIWVVLSGLAAIFGHNWPVYYRFKGGKGIATTIGTVATLGFVPSISAGVIAIILIVLFRYVSLGSLVFVTLLPVMMWLYRYPFEYILGAAVIMLFSYWRHRTNIVRLVKGQENKIGGSS